MRFVKNGSVPKHLSKLTKLFISLSVKGRSQDLKKK